MVINLSLKLQIQVNENSRIEKRFSNIFDKLIFYHDLLSITAQLLLSMHQSQKSQM